MTKRIFGVELATNAEALTGTDTERAVTPDDFTAYNDYVEACRAWGAAAKARLGV